MLKFFKKILSALGISGSKGESVIGLDIGSSSIKVVQLKKEKGVAVLETYGEISLGPYVDKSVGQAVKLPQDKLVEVVGDLLKEADVTTYNSGMTIPYSSSLISFIEVPHVKENKLQEMIPIEARKYIPVPLSEVVLDWFVVPEQAQETKKEKGGGRKGINVMIVAIHNNILDKYQYITQNTDLSASFFEIEIFSVTRSVIGRGTTPIMIVDVGSVSTKLYIVEQGVVKYSHSLAKGGQDITLALSRSRNISFKQAEEMKRNLKNVDKKGVPRLKRETEIVVNYILSEASKVLLSYQKRQTKNVSRVILTGGGVFLEGFIEDAKEKLDAEISVADPFSKVKTPAFLEDVLQGAGPEFSASIGAALRKLEESG